jgi:hypothetical protein
MIHEMQVGRADPASLGAHQYLAVAGSRIGGLPHFDYSASQNRCAHGSLLNTNFEFL